METSRMTRPTTALTLGLALLGAAGAFAGTLTVQTGSRYSGNYGLQVTPDSTPAFVQSSQPSAEKTYRVRFYVNLSRLNLASNSDFDLFVAYDGADPLPSSPPAGNPVLRAAVRQQADGSKVLDIFTRTSSGEVPVPSSPNLPAGWRAIELEWKASSAPGANNGAVNVWLDGNAQTGLANLNSDTQVINYVRWGNVSAVALGSPLPGAGGVNTFKLDEFGSQRSGALGLVNVFSDIGGLDPTFRQYVHALYNAGLTNGCSSNPLMYCPDSNVTRAEVAKFLELGMRGEIFLPPVSGASSFADAGSHWAKDWIQQLYADGLTNGCAVSPLRYCPDSSVSRAEMAKFILLARHGAGYNPPNVSVSSFADAQNHWAKNWIEQMKVEGLSNGCSTNPLQYCPDVPMTRWQMAKALTLAFNLPVPNGL
jgi:hypothetical protein